MTIADLPHLVRRFFGSLRARRPSPGDQRRVASLLPGEWGRLFFAQAAMDQAHSLAVADAVSAAAPARPDLVRAALLHDIGKATAGLGIPGRTIASLLAIVRVPGTAAMRRYLDHGQIGAALLADAGGDEIAIAFAREHHRPVAPPGVDAADWEVLRRADGK